MIEVKGINRTSEYVIVTLSDGRVLGAEVKGNHTNVYFLSDDHATRALIDSRPTTDEAVAVTDVLMMIAKDEPPVRRAAARLVQRAPSVVVIPGDNHAPITF